jgi:hypothetical protein
MIGLEIGRVFDGHESGMICRCDGLRYSRLRSLLTEIVSITINYVRWYVPAYCKQSFELPAKTSNGNNEHRVTI